MKNNRKRINLLNTKEKINVNLEFYHQQNYLSRANMK